LGSLSCLRLDTPEGGVPLDGPCIWAVIASGTPGVPLDYSCLILGERALPFPREGEGPLEAAFSCPILGKSKEALLLAAQGLGGILGVLPKGGGACLGRYLS
jgi:hypothetical protein